MTTPRLILCELHPSSLPSLPRLESFSPFCLKVHRALQLCGLPYERRFGANPAAFRQYNPAAQVPVLLVDGEPVADSTAIVSRLDILSGGALTRTLDASLRGEALLWEEMADSVLNGFLVAARWLDDENWPRTRAAYFAGMPAVLRAVVPGKLRGKVRKALFARDVVRPSLDGCWAKLEITLDALDARAPSRGYWLGDAPSRADVAMFGQLHSLCTELTPRQGERVRARGRLSAWLDRVDAACAHAVAGGASIADGASASATNDATTVPRLIAAFG